jgi:hypothetical protein
MRPRARSLARELGLEAGRIKLAAGLNPYPVGSLRAEIWQSARLEELSRRCSSDQLREECRKQQDLSARQVDPRDVERLMAARAERMARWKQ